MRHLPACSSLIPGSGANPMSRPSSGLSIRHLLRRDVLLYVAARVGQSALVLWAAFTLSFAILYVLPGDPVSIMVNQDGQSLVDGAELAKLKAEYNLDKPITEQYFIALWRVLHLDFGRSIQSGQTVASALANAIPPTANLAFCALVVALIMGVGLAVLGCLVQAPWLRTLLLALPSLGAALPTFWIGLLFLQVLSFHFTIFPAMGNDGWRSLVMPVATLAIPTSARIAQVMSRSLALVWSQPFTEAIRAKGVSRTHLMLVHTLPNAAIPLLTMAGLIVGGLLAGSVVTETVFSRDGIGRLAQGAVSAKDIPMVQGVVLVVAASFVVVNLIVDLLYPLLDPRITLSGKRR
ncbi:ABC transporter permease [Acetobacter vaccinii]|uniref:ABC transporter permease n=2 Tax=Acetobacter vaccinii TaxID=2592655 RepID=A0A5C1YQ71_9PROT|nr:ABC transporter permease [Acetobacter vaccinii]